jgi:hypothetical protein
MELLVAFLIAFGIVNSSDKDLLLKDASKTESIYKSSGLSSESFEAYKKKIVDLEQDGM